MYKIEFTLKQHTPLIHFQWDQEGATLRATEVKPKLDKFIKSIFKAKGEKIPTNWMVGKSTRNNDNDSFSLDYKLRIEAYGNKQEYAISSLPPSRKKDDKRAEDLLDKASSIYLNETQYFADNQYIDKPLEYSKIRKGILYEGATITLFSFVPELLDCIKDHFPKFIVSQNFGTRQTKGFGCFSIKGRTDQQIIQDLKEVPEITGIFQKLSNHSFDSKLKEISKGYAILKRGNSYPKYQKAKLWEYLCSTKDVKWEKRKIKLHIKSQNPKLFDELKCENNINRIDDCGTKQDENFYYIRALLGLAEQYEFVKSDFRRLKVKIKDSLQDDPNEKDKAIDRFRSPIRYYITDTSIFLLTEKINPLLQEYADSQGIKRDREFTFTIDELRNNKSFNLKVPKTFDLPGFINSSRDFGFNLK